MVDRKESQGRGRWHEETSLKTEVESSPTCPWVLMSVEKSVIYKLSSKMDLSDFTTVNRCSNQGWFYLLFKVLLPFFIIENILDSNKEEKHSPTIKSPTCKGFHLLIYLIFICIFFLFFILFIYFFFHFFFFVCLIVNSHNRKIWGPKMEPELFLSLALDDVDFNLQSLGWSVLVVIELCCATDECGCFGANLRVWIMEMRGQKVQG